MKFMINGNACISATLLANAVPNAVKMNARRNMKTRANGTNVRSTGLNPITIVIRRTRIPWMNATVAPPSVLPRKMLNREEGDTNVSFRNPSCLSQITSIPENIDANRIVIPIIPGAKN